MFLTISFLSTRSSAFEENIILTLLPTVPPFQIFVCQIKTKNQISKTSRRTKSEKKMKKIKQKFMYSYTNMVRDNHCRRSLKLIYQQRNPKIYKPCSEHPFIPKGLTNFANANITHLSFKSNHVPEFFMKNSNIRY